MYFGFVLLCFAWLGLAWYANSEEKVKQANKPGKPCIHGFMGSWVHGFLALLGLALLGFAWLCICLMGSWVHGFMALLCFAWLCLALLGLVLLGFAWLCLALFCLAWLCLAWLGLALLGFVWLCLFIEKINSEKKIGHDCVII